MVGFADRGHVKGCVIQVTVPRYVQADVLVETFDQEQLDSFFILVSDRRCCSVTITLAGWYGHAHAL